MAGPFTVSRVPDQIADIENLQDSLNTIEGKADDALEALSNKADEGHVHVPTDVTGLMGDDGKISLNYIPSTAISNVYVVASLEQQNLLTVETGDVAIRTDESKNYIYDGSEWKLLLTPPDLVQSVCGKVGAVSLTYADVGAAAAAHIHNHTRTLTIHVDGSGVVIIPATTVATWYAPVAYTITGWRCLSEDGVSGTITFTLSTSTLATFPSLSAMNGATAVGISASTTGTSDTTAWTDRTIDAGEMLNIGIATATSLKKVTLTLVMTEVI